MLLWQIKHNKGPSMVAQCARKHNKVPSTVPFQWRQCHAVLYGLPSMLANEFASKWLIVPCVFLSHSCILFRQQSSCAKSILTCLGINYTRVTWLGNMKPKKKKKASISFVFLNNRTSDLQRQFGAAAKEKQFSSSWTSSTGTNCDQIQCHKSTGALAYLFTDQFIWVWF